MKKSILSATAFIFLAIACQKTKMPTSTQNLNTQQANSTNQSFSSRIVGGGDGRGEPNFNAGPKDPACDPGSKQCVEVVVTTNYFSNLKLAVSNGKAPIFLSDSNNLAILSGGNPSMIALLNTVVSGNNKMLFVEMPNSQTTRGGFAIGSTSNMPNTSIVGAVITDY